MSGFLNRLAGFATGRPTGGLARVALPSCFAPISSAPLPSVDSETAEDFRTEPRSSDGAASPVRSAENAMREVAAAYPLENLRNTSPESASVAEQVAATPSHTASARVSPMPQRIMTPTVGVAPKLQPPLRVRVTQESAAPFLGTPPEEDAARTEAPIRAAAMAGRESAIANRPPLSADILAARPQAAQDAPPPIHVTIDRIDVRVAPAAKTTAPQTRARRAPSQSLGEYLRGPERGGRS